MSGFRREVYRSGVTVHIIEPGYFRTSIVDEQTVGDNLDRKFRAAPRDIQTYYGTDYLKQCMLLLVIVNHSEQG